MANIKSAAKRHRQNLKRRVRNRNAKSEIRSTLRKALDLAEKGNLKEARIVAQQATRLLDKAAAHSILHKKNAQRNISRLYRKISQKEKAA